MSAQERNPLHAPLSRRQALKLMGGLAGMAALAGCAAPVAAPAATGGEAAAPAGEMPKLVVAHRREYFAEMETLFADAVTKWGQENNVEIETTTVDAEASQNFVPKLLAQVQAGDPPNVVYHIRLTLQLYGQDAVEEVSDAVAEQEAMYGKAPRGQIINNVIDGKWYGIPYMMHGGGHFARRSVFDGKGIDVTTLTTWEQVRDACLTVSDSAADMYGWGLTINSGGDATGLIEGVMQDWGGHYTNEEATEVTFNSPETMGAIEFLAEIYTSEQYAPMLPPGVMSWNDSSNNEAYLASTIAYTSNAASVYAKAKADGLTEIFDDTHVMETLVGPAGQKREAGGGGQFIIPRGATHQDLSKQLAAHMITPPVFLPISLISAGLFLPAYANYYTMDEVVEAFDADPNLAMMGKHAQGEWLGASWPAQPSPYFDAIAAQAVLTDLLAQIVAQGVSVADAVAQAHERMVSIGQEMGMFS